MCWKRAPGMAMKLAGVRTWRMILFFWHATQVVIHRLMSLAMLGQKKRSVTNRFVALTPGWARLCNCSVIWRRSGSGTSGRGAARVISQITSAGESGSLTFPKRSLLPV